MGVFQIPGMSEAVSPNPKVTAFPATDSFTIASFNMPGKWTLQASKEFGWQIQQGFGLSGAVIFPKGDPPVVVKARGEFWAAQDYALYKEIRKRILLKPVFSLGGNLITAAMGMDHPEIKALGVINVVNLRAVSAVDEGGGLWVVEHEFLQYRPPLLAPPKPKLTIPDVAPPVPKAQDALDIEIQKTQAAIAARKAAL